MVTVNRFSIYPNIRPSPKVVLLANGLSGLNTQSTIQDYYSNYFGYDAPDTVPALVTAADDGGTGNGVYLGENVWFSRSGGTGSWTPFVGDKADFSDIERLYTFK